MVVAWSGRALSLAGCHMLPDAGMQVSCFVPSLLLLALVARALQDSWPFSVIEGVVAECYADAALLTVPGCVGQLATSAGLPSHCLAPQYVI